MEWIDVDQMNIIEKVSKDSSDESSVFSGFQNIKVAVKNDSILIIKLNDITFKNDLLRCGKFIKECEK